MIDNAMILRVLRPNARFNGSVNSFSRETLKETYIGDDFPEQEEWNTVSELPFAKEDAIRHIKSEASKRILAKMPIWKQINLVVSGDTQAVADAVNPIRDASDTIETEINSKAKVSTVQAVKITDHPSWPA